MADPGKPEQPKIPNVRLGQPVSVGGMDLWVRASYGFGFLCSTCHIIVTGQMQSSQIEARVACTGCGSIFTVRATPSANTIIEGITASVRRG